MPASIFFSPAPNLLPLTHAFFSNQMSLSLCLSSGTGLKFHTEPAAGFTVADDLFESCSFSSGQGKFAMEFSSTHHLLQLTGDWENLSLALSWENLSSVQLPATNFSTILNKALLSKHMLCWHHISWILYILFEGGKRTYVYIYIKIYILIHQLRYRCYKE